MPHFAGVMSVIPAILLVVLSYFVLVVRDKTAEPSLKVFGLVAAVLLWVSAGLALGMGFTGMSGRPAPMAGKAWIGRAPMQSRPAYGPGSGCMRGPGAMNDQACPWQQEPEVVPAPENPETKEGPKK